MLSGLVDAISITLLSFAIAVTVDKAIRRWKEEYKNNLERWEFYLTATFALLLSFLWVAIALCLALNL